jgi:hypothetical protein
MTADGHAQLASLARVLELGEVRRAAERPARLCGRRGELWVELTDGGDTVELAVGPLRPLPAGLVLEPGPRRELDLQLDGGLDAVLRARSTHPAFALRLLRTPVVREALLRAAAAAPRRELRQGWAWCELPAGDLEAVRPAAAALLHLADVLQEVSRELSLQAATDRVAAREQQAALPSRRFFAPAPPVPPSDARLAALHRLARAHLAWRRPARELVPLLVEAGATSALEARGVASAVLWERALSDRERWPDAVAWGGGAAAWLCWTLLLAAGPASALDRERWAGLAFLLACTVAGLSLARAAWRDRLTPPGGP